MKRHPLGLMITIVLLQTACTSQQEQLATTNTAASYIKTLPISETNITADKKDRHSTAHVMLEKESQDELSAAASNRVDASFAKSRMKVEKRQSNQGMSRQAPMAMGQVMAYVSAPAPVMDTYNVPREERDQFAHFNDNPVKQVVSDPVSTFSLDNVGVTDTNQIKDMVKRERETGITLSTLGFGQGNYNDAMMEQIADVGNGNYSYIDSLNEARKVLVDELGSTFNTVAKDVKVQIEFNPNVVSEYRLLGYENRQLNREDFNNDKVDAGDVGAGKSVTAIYEITPKTATPAMDALRYQNGKPVLETSKTNSNQELAFLKIRYKNPKVRKVFC